MDFPITDLLDEQACYDWLVARLYPRGLACPGCGRRRGPGVHRRPSELVLILRGVARGEPTARLARESGCSRRHLLELRHRLHHFAERFLPRRPLPDAAAEADEMYQNAGEKRRPAPRPRRPAPAAR